MDNFLYFGNLPFDASDEMITSAVSPIAVVKKVTLAVDPPTGRFMGYAFVELGSKDDVAKVIQGLNEKEVGGRNCFLDHASNQKDLWQRVFPNS